MKNIKEEYENKNCWLSTYRWRWKKEKLINAKLSQLPSHNILQRFSLDDLIWDFFAVSLYPSAINDSKSIYPRIETSYGFTKDMNDEHVKKFNSGNFTQGSAILIIK